MMKYLLKKNKNLKELMNYFSPFSLHSSLAEKKRKNIFTRVKEIDSVKQSMYTITYMLLWAGGAIVLGSLYRKATIT